MAASVPDQRECESAQHQPSWSSGVFRNCCDAGGKTEEKSPKKITGIRIGRLELECEAKPEEQESGGGCVSPEKCRIGPEWRGQTHGQCCDHSPADVRTKS